MKKKKTVSSSAFFNPRSLIGLTLCVVGAILALFAFGLLTSRPVQAQGLKQGQTTKVRVLTLMTAPVVTQCQGILNQDIINLVNSAKEDPVVTYEKNRRAHPHMIAVPPPLDCAGALWRAIRKEGKPQANADPIALHLRQYAAFSVFSPHPLAALIGTNIDLSNGVQNYQGETNIAIDPNNPLHMVAHSNTFYADPTAQCQSPTGGSAGTFGTMALFGSTDGGQTWTYNCAPWPASVTGGVTGAAFWFGSDPALSWDNQGRAYATYMLISQSSAGASGASIVTARSTDNGASWQSLGTVVSGITSTTAGNDKEMMAIDNTTGQAFSHPGRMYVIWDAANVERIAFSDNGTTWTTIQPSNNTGAIGGNVVVGADGTVYIIWNRFNVETIVFSKSTNGGASWTAPTVIATAALQSFGANNKPPAQDTRGINAFGAIDIDRNPNSAFFGTLYVSFSDFPAGTTSGTDLNTYLIRSTNGGTTWASRVKVNDDSFGATQFFPWVAVDQSDGSVNVSWIDTRIDPLNRETQAVYARSTDGGVSFEPNILVEDNGANWRNNVNYSDENTIDNTNFNGNQYGDYTGIAALNRQVHPLWTDSRSFFPTADTQSPTRREDIGTSTIINCSAPSAVAAPTVNSSTAPNVAVNWSAPSGWGTNATNGTYSVYRNTTPVFPGGSALASGLTATSYVDTTGIGGTTYYYFIRSTNNCPGTPLTPMTADSGASAAIVYGSTGTPTGTLQGNVISGSNPVSNVVVFAGTLSATTNGSGFYQIPGINAGTYTVSASPAGYAAASASGVVVNGGATTTQNLSLVANSASGCFTDTNFGDYQMGSGTNADIAVSPGDVKLANLGGETTDQVSSPAALSTGNTPTSTTWSGQTFRAGKTGNLTKISVGLGLNSGTTGTVTVEIRNLNGVNPGATVLASSTLGPVTNVGTAALYTTTFSSPAAVVSGTSYSIVIKGGTGSVFSVRGSTAGGSSLANGQFFTTTTSGSSWTAVAADLYFTSYVTPPLTYQTSGNFISSVKDSGAVTGAAANWLTLSWTNAAFPAGTNIQFQAAASNSASGPFNFVGPDNTAGTFFTSGGSLAQFNGNRYLKYKALLTTSNTANTPTLNDVTACSSAAQSVGATNLVANSASGSYGGTTTLAATLTSGANGVSGKSVSFTLNGNSVGSASTDGSGVATLSNVSLSGINAGTYPSGVGASFAGDGSYASGSSTNSLTVNQASTTTGLTSDNNPSMVGTQVTFTATVSSTAGTPSGTVTFKDNNATIGTGTLSGGVATFSTSSLTVGSHPITATYEADTNFAGSSSNTLTQIVNTSAAPTLTSAASRLTHTGVGDLNLNLPLDGSGVEPRDGGGNYTIVLTFDNPVDGGSATVTSGTGTAGSPTFNGNDMIVTVSGVTDQQVTAVTASNVHGTYNTATLPSASVSAGFLAGDVNSDREVNVGDTIVVRSQAGVTLTNSTCIYDVNLDGQVDIGDTAVVRGKSGDFLP